MIRYFIYIGLMMIFLASCNSFQRQLRLYPPHCQQLLQELKYRIIKNDTGGYTFRFEHPVSDTIPLSETPRDLEYQNFIKTVFASCAGDVLIPVIININNKSLFIVCAMACKIKNRMAVKPSGQQ